MVVACLDRSHCDQIQNSSSKARMRSGLDSKSVVGKFAAENQAKLEALRAQREWRTVLVGAVGVGGVAGLAIFSPAALLLFPPLEFSLGELQRVSQRFLVMSELVEALEDEDVQIEVGLKAEGVREIDFFLRFSDKEYVLIQIRSLGYAKVAFDEKIGALRFRGRKGGFRTWEPSPLQELAEQERWIRKYRSNLLGTTAREKRQPIAKLLIVWDDTLTFLSEHPEHLYATIDSQKFLTVRTTGTVSIVMRDQIVSFIRAYLSSRRSSKPSSHK